MVAEWNYTDTSMAWPGLIEATNYTTWGSNIFPDISVADWTTDIQGWVINGDNSATYTYNGDFWTICFNSS